MNFTKLMKLGFLLSLPEGYREQCIASGKEKKRSRNEGSSRESSSIKKARKENSICNQKSFN